MIAVPPPGTGPPPTGPPATLPPGTGLFQYTVYTFFSDRLLYVTNVARPFSSLVDATTVLITRCTMVWGVHQLDGLLLIVITMLRITRKR